MGVEGCTKCIKYLLFFFNFIFWLAGCLILGGSLWLRYDEQTGSLLNAQLDGATPPKTFYISIYALIAVGAVMMFVGFLGCYGAIQESQCLLGTFFACLVILFACGAAAGIWGFINKDKITEEATNFYDSIYENAKGNNEAAKKVLQGIQEALKCCGKSSGLIDTFSDAKCVFGTKCHSRIYELFNNNIYIIGIAALIAAVIMIFEMIFSMVLCCGIRNSPVY